MPRIAIIESNRTKAELLCLYLARLPRSEIAAMECDVVSGIRAVKRVNPDLILASLAMPDCSAAEIIVQLRSVAPTARLIGLVSRCSEFLVYSVANSGCHGLFLETVEELTRLTRAIEHVMLGRRVISDSIVGYQLVLRTTPDAFPKMLSKRELETLICIAHTMTDEEIGRQIAISSGTVQSHRKNIMGKLGIHSTPKLICYCLEKGFHAAGLPSPTLRNRRKTATRAAWTGQQDTPVRQSCRA